MRKLCAHVLLVCAMALFCFAAGAEDFAVNYEKLEDAVGNVFQPWSGGGVDRVLDVPAGNWKLPKLNAPFPVYGFLTLGNTKRLFILDQAAKDNEFYNRLYLDVNANNDLTDDSVIEGSFQYRGQFAVETSFPSQDITYQWEGKTLPYRFRLSGSLYFSMGQRERITKDILTQRFYPSVSARCVYKSQVTVGGQKYQILLSDTNCNGRFDDVLSLPPDYKKAFQYSRKIYPSGDNIYLRKEGFFSWNDEQRFAKKIFLEGRLYDLSISLAQGKLTLNPSSDATATIKLPMQVDKLGLYREDGGMSINIYNAAEDIKVPAGNYLLTGYTVSRKDGSGAEWWLKTTASINTPIASIAENAVTTLKMGEPFLPRVDFPYWSLQNFKSNQKSIQLNMVTEGIGGEEIDEISLRPNQKTDIHLSEKAANRPKEATYTISNLDGTIVAQGRFEYG